MVSFLQKHISGKKVLIWFLLANIIYIIMLTLTIPGVMEYAGGMKLFDMMPTGYDHGYAKSLLERLGGEGRNAYLSRQIPLDMVYPALFGISYCLLIAYFLNKLGWLKKPFVFISLLPIIAGIFDYLENIGVILMVNNFPDLSAGLVKTAHTFTVLKSLLTTIFFAILLIAIIVFLIRKVISKK